MPSPIPLHQNSPARIASSNPQYLWSARCIDAPIVRFHDGNGDADSLDAGENIRDDTRDANFNVTAYSDLTVLPAKRLRQPTDAE
ncbi:MAG: hypothetical protein GXX96_22375 [Planctomycetaceae bacterium]|nr:hypothetical protein [Planctomycetaceae bacterium]